MLTLHQFFGLIALVSGAAAIAGMIWVAVVPRDRYEENDRNRGYEGYDGELGPETVRLSADPDTGEFARIEADDEWDDATLASLHDDSGAEAFRSSEGLVGNASVPVWPSQYETWHPHDEPPTDERMERVVLALTETPEAWRARVEQDDHEWRAHMQGYFAEPVDFGTPLELAA